MNKIFACVYCFISLISCHSNGYDPYNFCFNADNTEWYRTKGVVILMDSISGKMYLTGESIDKIIIPPSGAIYQTIYLPEIRDEKIQITLKARSSNVESSFLKVTGYDSKENMLCTASSQLKDRGEFCDAEITIPSHDVRFMKLIIEVSGIKDAKKREHALYLDRMEVKAGGKNIETLSIPKLHATIAPQKVIVLDQNFSLDMDIEDKKIIGIGETVHGSSTLEKCSFELMKDIVARHNGRLIIMEATTNFMLKWNLFITDHADFTYEELVADMYGYSCSPDLLFEFLLWLKQYNQNRERKVRILGMDKVYSGFESSFIWADYMYHFMEKNRHPLLDTLSTLLIKSKYNQAKMTAQNSEIRQIMGEEEWMFFMQAIPKLALISEDLVSLFQINCSAEDELRERLMSTNVQEAISFGLNENEKVIVFAHLEHIGNHSFVGDYKEHSLGYHLNSQYGNKFYKIGLLTGTGTYTAINPTNGKMSSNDLELPAPNSLEEACMKTGHHFFFCSVDAISEKILSTRFLGKVALKNQFQNYVSLENRMDALIFVKESQSFDIPVLWLDSSIYEKKRMERLYQTMERNRVLQKNK